MPGEPFGEKAEKEHKYMNNRKIGTEQEKIAAQFLRAEGMQILETNFRCRQGEVDIVGLHKGYLTFVEVKYR